MTLQKTFPSAQQFPQPPGILADFSLHNGPGLQVEVQN